MCVVVRAGAWYASHMDTDARRIPINRKRWVTFYVAGAVVYDRDHGVWDAFPLSTPPEDPKRVTEENALLDRLHRAYAA